MSAEADLAALLAASEANDPFRDDGVVARDVIRLEQRIRRRFVRVAAGAVVLSLLSIAGLWYAGLISRISPGPTTPPSMQPPDLWDVDLSLSSTTCLSTLAVLATVIVALQVAVRPGTSFVDGILAEQVARIRALESLALLAGLAAVATGVFGALRVGLDSAWTHPLHLFGPVAVGSLLCAVATDASTASQSRYGPVVSAEYLRQTYARYETARTELSYRATVATRPAFGELGQGVAIAVCVAALSVAPALAFDDGRPWWRLALGTFLTLGFGVVSTAAAAGLAGHHARLRERWATAFYILVGLVFGIVTILVTGQIALNHVRTNAGAVQVLVLLLLDCLLLTLSAALTSGPPPRWSAPGVCRRLSEKAYVRKLESWMTSTPRDPSRARSPLLTSIVSGIGVILSALVPPLGLIVAGRVIASEQRGAKRTCAVVAVVLALTITVAAVIVGIKAEALFFTPAG
ncbi:hypothetical protein [Frigoribacterium sp. VKM Ac-2836]|uniref:hypothetical protein n=1 Tax=Frigoribacterium sp. VKM Ac-2836 TaxID=2739014 RepID=UPI0015658610|nr:hypothetical protein [Frigoribacterium sp. VKM Ac-2836]NRD27147.1 hypothetical protein [Frigoribacterium sp. VKM Ac-2836]